MIHPEDLNWKGERMFPDQFIDCPCCGGPMPTGSVVCWPCHGLTNALQPGRHFLTRQIRTITEPEINNWTAARDARVTK